MYKIQTLNKIDEKGLALLSSDNYSISDDIKDPDAIILRSYKMHDMEIPSSVLAIARAGAGVNNIPLDKCTEKGIVVFNTPGANANGVKEMVIAGLLLSSRKIIEANIWAQTLKGKGEEVGKLVEKGKSAFAGPEIQGKKLGVVGLGAIGVLVANAAVALGMEVYGVDPFLSVEAAWGLSPSVHKAKSKEEVFALCDYVSLHLPLNDKTKGMVNKTILDQVRPGFRLLNFARDGLVDDTDLLAALDSGKIERYVTDFPTDAVLGHEKVLPIPHLGASTPESEINCAVMAANQMKDFLENGNVHNSVNIASCSMVRGKGARILIINDNIPKMLSQILGILADNGINIDEMVNKHRNGIAYNIIDISESEVSKETVGKISSIDGIIGVRVLSV